jgi:hypothetical protein
MIALTISENSTTMVDNLNADLLDGYDAADFQSYSANNALYKYGNSSFTDNDTEQTFVDAFCDANSLVVVSITGATPAGVWSVESGSGSFTITSDTAGNTDITFDYYIIKVG